MNIPTILFMDIYADAKDINEARLAAQEAAVVEDASEEDAPAAE